MQEIVSSEIKTVYQNKEKPENFTIENLQNQRYLLIKQKYEYEKKIKELETFIREKEFQIAKVCKDSDEGHQWITEREDGPYGERYTYCKKCRIDYYGNYVH